MRTLVTACWALGLTACATTPPVTPEVLQSTVLPANWTLQGRISIQADAQSLAGKIHWQHRADSDELLVASPLGQGVARIERNADGVTLDLPQQPSRHARDAESLTQEALGYALPLSGLTWWVQARPAPGSAFEFKHDGVGRLAQLRQDGWVIDYLEYAAEMPARPRKLAVAREGLSIRLVADTWTDE
jgi:outer membrane lipoprotein LolB